MFFTKKEEKYDFSFLDKEIQELENDFFINENDKQLLHSNNPIEKLKTLIKIQKTELCYWKNSNKLIQLLYLQFLQTENF